MKTLALALALLLPAAAAAAAPLKVVAAENFYGDVAAEIGGAQVEVTSLLQNPDDDPHLFEASPQTARAVAGADVAILNGADYDPWMRKLISASPNAARRVLDVGALAGAKPGANPHIWYSTEVMRTAASALTQAFAAADPVHAAEYKARAAAFTQSLNGLDEKTAAIRARHHGAAVAASEPVFGYALEAAGLDVREQRFALAVMNDTEPSPSDVAGFESDIRDRKLRVFVYNAQASEPAVERLVALAKENGVPVVGVTETEPANTHYVDWVKGELDALDHALGVKTH